ncbi:MAG: aldo/keto reductase [Nitrospirae bacterium]|nr:aldo/keto reductase [Nitrospirota bacterium]
MKNGKEAVLGRTGMKVGRLGVASSYGVGARDLEWAFERGVNYFYWGSARRSGFRDGVRSLSAKHRDRMVVVVQSYSRVAKLMEWSVDRALRSLKLDSADVLLLGWWNRQPPERIRDSAARLVEKGKVRCLALSSHHRPYGATILEKGLFDILHIRYNAAHRGAEKEIFPQVKKGGPGLVTYTTTRWGTLLKRPKGLPDSVPVPTATDCYRFALSNPAIDVVMSGPANHDQMKSAVDALEKGPMVEDELTWMRKVGDAVHKQAPKASVFSTAVAELDRFRGDVDLS